MSCGNPHATPCSEVLAEMHSYLDGEITDERRLLIHVHLEECGPCLSEYGIEREVKLLVARCCAGEHAPPLVKRRIQEKLRGLLVERSGIEFRAD